MGKTVGIPISIVDETLCSKVKFHVLFETVINNFAHENGDGRWCMKKNSSG